MKSACLRLSTLLSCVLLSAALSTPVEAKNSAAVDDAVVKVLVTVRDPDPTRPWSKRPPRDASGSGVVIEGKRILTNAHVVRYANEIQIQANQSGNKIPAKLVALAPGIDLAVLKLEDEGFFKDHPALPRSTALPNVKDEVMAYGFPVGGNSMSITKGIVSRVEFVGYNFPTYGLRIQVDAAINPGNSGGPAVVGNEMIGLTFAHLSSAQNVGYIIPNEEIELFLQDVADGKYDGKPALFDEFQSLENASLRAFLRIDAATKGALVHEPYSNDASYPLKEWDVVTHIGNTPIDDDGMIKLNDKLRVNFRYFVQKTAKNGMVPLTVLRNQKTLQVQVPVTSERPTLLPDLGDNYPSYFVYGPLVFTKGSAQYLALMSSNTAALTGLTILGNPMVTQRMDKPTTQREELVLIAAPMFPHRLSRGYRNMPSSVVESINGVKVKSLAHLVALLRDSKDEFVVFKMDQRGGDTLVFRRKEMEEATEEILADNDVRAQGSPDAMSVWQKKAN